MRVLGIFCVGLLLCMALGLPLLGALLFGLALFVGEGLRQGFSPRELLAYMRSGVRSASGILIVFFFIGMLTAAWRAAGTLPLIICYAVDLISPQTVLLMAFLLTSAVSFLTGTAFGTAATMGVICMTVGRSLGLNAVALGGAILSGCYFGDRVSPVSTSALLVATITGTELYANIKGMLRTGAVAFVLCALIYGVYGYQTAPSGGTVINMWDFYRQEFDLQGLLVLPALLILALSLAHVNVRIAMGVSIISAFALALATQHYSFGALCQFLVTGYRADNPAVGVMANGGGITSMLRVAAIICLSSSYTGLFRATGLLEQVRSKISSLACRAGRYGATLITSILCSMIACNQTLAIMLTHELCKDLEDDASQLALALANSAVIVAPLVPWSIAGTVVLITVGAPLSGIAWALYLYLLPLTEVMRNKE